MEEAVQGFDEAVGLVLNGMIPNFNAEQISNTDQANKNFIRYASGMADSIGHGTDASLAAAVSGNGSTHISNLAAQQFLKVNIALERYQQALVSSFEASRQPASNFGAYQANFARTLDPRGFMLDLLPTADRVKMLRGMTSTTAKSALIAGKRAAEAAGQFSEKGIPQ